MADRPAQKMTGSQAPLGNSAENDRNPSTSGFDRSAPRMSKTKRDLYVVPDEQLPKSRGDLADQVETEKEVEHEQELKASWEPMPGMGGSPEELQERAEGTEDESDADRSASRIADTAGARITPPPGMATSPENVSAENPRSSLDAGGATSGTGAGLGSTDKGRPTNASAAGMTGKGVAQGASAHGTAGGIETHGAGRSGSQAPKKKGS